MFWAYLQSDPASGTTGSKLFVPPLPMAGPPAQLRSDRSTGALAPSGRSPAAAVLVPPAEGFGDGGQGVGDVSQVAVINPAGVELAG